MPVLSLNLEEQDTTKSHRWRHLLLGSPSPMAKLSASGNSSRQRHHNKAWSSSSEARTSTSRRPLPNLNRFVSPCSCSGARAATLTARI